MGGSRSGHGEVKLKKLFKNAKNQYIRVFEGGDHESGLSSDVSRLSLRSRSGHGQVKLKKSLKNAKNQYIGVFEGGDHESGLNNDLSRVRSNSKSTTLQANGCKDLMLKIFIEVRVKVRSGHGEVKLKKSFKNAKNQSSALIPL